MKLPDDVTILLVEDDPDDVFLMQRALKAANVTNSIQVAEHGLQALDYLNGNGEYVDRARFPLPRLVFFDLKLPYKSGFDVLQHLTEQKQVLERMAIVVLTSSSQPRDIQRAYQLGARSYLVKPPNRQMLEDLFASLESFWQKAGG
jgi:CheY-like chemotaxis protein